MNQRRFEANTLAGVLAKVQKEIGPQAKIASAQKIRSGGIFGFFERERYEVIVDVSTNAAGKFTQPDDSDDILDFARVTAAREELSGSIRGFNSQQDEGIDDEPPPRSLLDLAERINAFEAGISGATPTTDQQVDSAGNTFSPRVSTESSSFADILSRVAFQADMTSNDDPDVIEASSNSSVNNSANPLVPDRPSFLDQPAQLPEPVKAPATAVEIPARSIVAHPVFRADLPATDEGPALDLRELGLPKALMPEVIYPEDETSQDQHKALRMALTETLARHLPVAPDIEPERGTIIAVVGDRASAVALAEELATEWGHPDRDIVIASQTYRGKRSTSVLRTSRNALDAQRSWRRRRQPTIVAIDAQPGSLDVRWAENVLAALEPIASYGVVEATRKAEDISQWATALGGLDVLAVNDLDKTTSPAAILATGLPVGRLDGYKASPALWAMILTDRLENKQCFTRELV